MRSWLYSSALALLFVFGCCGQKSTTGTSTGAGENGTTGGDRKEAPKHNAPDQDRIDSLKQEKQKDKQ